MKKSNLNFLLKKETVLKYINIGSKISKTVSDLLINPNVGSISKFIFEIGSETIDNIFPPLLNECVLFEPNDICSYIYNIVINEGKFVCSTIRNRSYADDDTVYKIYDFFDEILIFEMKKSNDTVYGIFLNKNRVNDFINKLKPFFWRNGNNLLLQSKNVNKGGKFIFYDKIISFINDDLYQPLSTQKGLELFEYYRKCYGYRLHRSVLFYGIPGTGKSSMVKFIVSKLGLKSIRIMASDLSTLDVYKTKKLIDITQPQCLIIEDMDKVCLNVDMLEFFELLKPNLEFIFITVNEKDKIEPSLLRPGRIDEFILVDRIDDGVIINLLGNENKDLVEYVRNWPVAYINEFKNRIKVMGRDEALSSINELSARVEDLLRDDDEEKPKENGDDNKSGVEHIDRFIKKYAVKKK